MTPCHPEFSPTALEIRAGERNVRRKPIAQRVTRTGRAMKRKNFQAARRELAVFSQLLTKESASAKPARIQIDRTNISL